VKVDYFAPLPPARTGVAAYAECLLEALRRRVDVTVGGRGGLALYQIGNNRLHWEIYQQALERQGVVLLHDAVLHHLLLGQLVEEEYVEEFVYNYGEWYRETAGRYWRERGGSAADARYFARPMLRRLCAGARLVVVHNAAAERAVREHAPEVKVLCLPHLFAAPRDHFYREIDLYREEVLGVPRGELLVGVLGHLRESKRVASVWEAVRALRRRGVAVRLLLQGECVGEDLARQVERMSAEGWVVRRGYLEEDEWWMQAHAVDVGVNLRWPTAGESSGITTRLMGIGRPVVVTRGLETAELPEVAVVKVDAGVAEREQLEWYLAWMAENVEARRAVGRHAAIHVAQFHRVEVVAERLAAAMEDLKRVAFSNRTMSLKE
jgi:glycosyltransferase involved in cell wall biosynthesis